MAAVPIRLTWTDLWPILIRGTLRQTKSEDALPGYVDINPYRKTTRKRFKFGGLIALLLVTTGVVFLALFR
ncbi:hypothetical protein BMF89_14355 [Arthrobacter sp. SRS-W-1-2016]|jgi:hypothetical protein|nr:hypothetical protein BMF89_14355 [Arthrobacter sp. SRS-W-1-2016]